MATDYRSREESITLSSEPVGESHELLSLNMGPHHPATHGVLRLLVTLEGEIGVLVDHEESGSAALVRIADTGIGVSEDQRPRLFERFHRVEGAQGRSFEGTGIGLALVHELVKLHGGSIDAESSLGAGTRFRIHLPFGTAHLPADRVRASRSLTSTASGARTFVQEALHWLQDPADAARGGGQPLADPAPGLRDRRFAATFGSRIVLADDRSVRADMTASWLAQMGWETYVLDGGYDGALEVTPPLVWPKSDPAHRYRRPYEGTDVNASAMQAYLDWEYGLVEQLRRDATHGFFVI